MNVDGLHTNGLGSISIYLLGTDDPVSLPVIRALGTIMPEASLHAFSRENGRIPAAKYSRYLKSHHLLEAGPDQKISDEIASAIEEPGNTVLLPMSEDFVRILSKTKSRFDGLAWLPPLPDCDLLDSLIYKNRLYELLKENDLPSPETLPLDRVNPSLLDDGFFPCLLKPVRGSAGYGIREVADRRMLEEAAEWSDAENWILQEFIPGGNIDCSFLADQGEIRALTVQRGLESKGFAFSTAICFEYDQRVAECARKLIAATSYSGLAHLDFRLDERDGIPKLIDFNARFWHSLLGSRAAGVDFSHLYCLSALGRTFEAPGFSDSIYLMGKSTFSHFRQYPGSLFRSGSNGSNGRIFTDLRDRILDPLPEFVRLIN